MTTAEAGRARGEAGTGLRRMRAPVGTTAIAMTAAPSGPASATAAAPRLVEAERQSRVFCAAMGSPMACGRCARQSSQWAECPWDLARSAADAHEKGNPSEGPAAKSGGARDRPQKLQPDHRSGQAHADRLRTSGRRRLQHAGRRANRCTDRDSPSPHATPSAVRQNCCGCSHE